MILVECYGDEALVNYCGYKNILHMHGSGNIAKYLSKHENMIAMVDEDTGKTIPNYFKKLQLIKEPSYAVSVWRDDSLNNLVVKIEPDLEGWIWKVIEDTNSRGLLK